MISFMDLLVRSLDSWLIKRRIRSFKSCVQLLHNNICTFNLRTVDTLHTFTMHLARILKRILLLGANKSLFLMRRVKTVSLAMFSASSNKFS